jgi:hypothetical protein
MTQVAEVCFWAVLWLVIGLAFGIYSGEHGWVMMPIVGATYGLLAGCLYSLISFLYRNQRGQFGLVNASLLGLVASTCTVPILVMLTVQLKAALFFTIVAGPLSGIAVHRLRSEKHNVGADT